MKSGNISWVWYVAFMGEMKNSYRILAGKPE
jgi:hypothetical protein